MNKERNAYLPNVPDREVVSVSRQIFPTGLSVGLVLKHSALEPDTMMPGMSRYVIE